MPHRQAASLAAIVMGSAKVGPPARAHIKAELDEVSKIKAIQPSDRRRLFQIIHAIRAFDSSLAAVAVHHACTPANRSMGSYLRAFANQPMIPFSATDRQYYQRRLVNRRNALMHEAGIYPAGTQE